jgi:hypothetical protein
MTVEEYFEEWWTPKELPKNGFNKTAMLDFAEMYHKQALRIHDVIGRSEQLKCEHRGRRTATELVEYCEDCKKILFHP